MFVGPDSPDYLQFSLIALLTGVLLGGAYMLIKYIEKDLRDFPVIRFMLGAALLNALPIILFLRLRHRVAHWPMPGLWWLGAAIITLILTLLLARATL